jgi:6-pyruvoyltetrahydropterin/6-carboxytetrahydropterin synthase
MLELSRTIRFCLAHDGSLSSDAPRHNTFAAWPPMRGLGRYYELTVTCRGVADATTGYFMNIKQIDEAVRAGALPLIAAAAQAPGPPPLGWLMRDIISALGPRLRDCVRAAQLRLTPMHSLGMEKHAMSQLLVSQRYEFSAAHRLHAAALSDEENRRIFGKCNNPAGHGHNYQLEVTVRCPVSARGDVMAIEQLDAVVNAAVIEKLDHKHLDVDVPQFRGVNTTVENIARIIHGMLRDEVRRLGVELEEVRVWETGKTVCSYQGE